VAGAERTERDPLWISIHSLFHQFADHPHEAADAPIVLRERDSIGFPALCGFRRGRTALPCDRK
jgi:hypothetical protein